MILGAIQSIQGQTNAEKLCLARPGLVSAFGIFGCVQLIRGKSARLLLLALTLGAVARRARHGRGSTHPAHARRSGQIVMDDKPDDLDESGIGIKPFEERIDTQKIELGIVCHPHLCRAFALSDVAAGQEIHLPMSTRSWPLTRERAASPRSVMATDSDSTIRFESPPESLRLGSESSGSGGRAIERAAPDRLRLEEDAGGVEGRAGRRDETLLVGRGRDTRVAHQQPNQGRLGQGQVPPAELLGLDARMSCRRYGSASGRHPRRYPAPAGSAQPDATARRASSGRMHLRNPPRSGMWYIETVPS